MARTPSLSFDEEKTGTFLGSYDDDVSLKKIATRGCHKI
jgi:hypothetical protein